jgi:hypothetical protein
MGKLTSPYGTQRTHEICSAQAQRCGAERKRS